VAFAGVASPGHAEEVVLGLEQAVTGQSNLFRSTVGSIADGNYEFSPYLRLLGEHGNTEYSVEYRPSYEVYFVSEDVNGLDQFFRTNVVSNLLPVSRLRFRLDYADYRSVRAVTADGPAGIPDVVPQATGRIKRTFANLDYEHDVTRSTRAAGRLAFQSYNYTTPSNADSLGIAAEGNVVHFLRQEIGIGGSVLLSHRRFDELDLQPASQNTVANANLLVLYEPAPSWFIELSAGPAAIFTRQDELGPQVVDRWFGVPTDQGDVIRRFQTDPTQGGACASINGQPVLVTCPIAIYPGFPGDITEQVVVTFDPGTQTTTSDQDLVTGFVNAELRKEDSWGYASLVYFRSEDASAGIGTTTVRDSITATIFTRPFAFFDLRIRANWNRRQATGASNQFTVRAGASTIISPDGDPVAQANGLIDTGLQTETEINQYWADVVATREVYDRLWIDLGFRFLHQDRLDQPLGDTRRFDNYVGSLMMRYELPPVELF
jgi:hypothetical protein